MNAQLLYVMLGAFNLSTAGMLFALMIGEATRNDLRVLTCLQFTANLLLAAWMGWCAFGPQ